MSALQELLVIRQQIVTVLDKVCALISDYESPPENVKIYDSGLDAHRICTQQDVDRMVEALDRRRAKESAL